MWFGKIGQGVIGLDSKQVLTATNLNFTISRAGAANTRFDLGAVQSFAESVRRAGQHHSSRSHSGASTSSAMQREGAHEKPSFCKKLGFLSLCSLPTRGSSKVMRPDRERVNNNGTRKSDNY